MTFFNTILAVTIAAFGLQAGAAFAQKQQNWDMANEYAATSTHGQAQQVFADAVKRESGGSIVVTNHFGGSIGYKSKEHFDAVGDGALQIANTSVGQIAGIEPIFLLSSLPFLVSTVDEAQLLYEIAKPYYAEVLAKHNQVLLYASPWTPAGIWAKKPVNSSRALRGVKIRAWDASGTSTLKAAGAAAVQMSWADVVPQLAAGGIDAVLTSADGGTNANFWEHLSHFSEINYSMSLNMTHMNKDVYDSLSRRQKRAVAKAAEEASQAGWAAVDKRMKDSYATMRQNGITILTDVPGRFLADLNSAGEGVYTKWVGDVGRTGEKLLSEFNKRKSR